MVHRCELGSARVRVDSVKISDSWLRACVLRSTLTASEAEAL